MARFRPVDDRRRGGVWGFFSTLIGLGVIAAAALFVAVFAFNAEATRAGPAEADTTFVVERGQSAAAIGSALERDGLIRNAFLFRLATRAFANGRSLQAGEYEIEAGQSMRAIVRKMAEGDVVDYSITFAEGVTIAAVMRIIAESEYLTGDLPEAPPEGSILPETYHVTRGMTRAALLQQMRNARDAVLAEVWEGRRPNLPINSPEELVTLASIVERETGVAEERPLVASAFINRLRRPMRLESDPTIIYGVCKQYPDRCRDGRLVDAQGYPRVIRASEIAMRNPYNTYQIDRLPPTPIANPGRAALEATARPADSDAIFFVADGTGGHVFAATLAEHNANVARWRQIEAQRLAAERANR